ncbi:hypothetical protein [Kribbella kalugense]|uniref:GrpE protein n=1 Tax=Kribbella kalugense TaxID=2512221 RepID=A0A4R7ZC29_9ACTN|nr:hypothetical protein [Kribbella kalugense]TDW15049.1 hypothetical protein EV650_6529 [Kribbella kalugense]
MTWAGVRQWRQHKAFRIAAPRWSGTEYDDLDRYLTELGETARPAESPPEDSSLAEAATNLWRARRKLAQGNDGQGKQAARYLRTCTEALAAAGLTVQDHDGEPFHAGRSVDVLLYSDDPEVTVETVVETVRPAVYHHDRRIQTAQVIVAVPSTPTDREDSHA